MMLCSCTEGSSKQCSSDSFTRQIATEFFNILSIPACLTEGLMEQRFVGKPDIESYNCVLEAFAFHDMER